MTADELRATLQRGFQQLARALEEPGRPTGTPLQRAILAALTAEPTPAKQLAKKARRKFNSAFRAALRLLVDAGRARRTSQGYALP